LPSAGVMRLGEGTPSYDSEMEVDERLPWEHISGARVGVLASKAGRLAPLHSARAPLYF